jgi:hypothetical protein
MKMLFSNCVRDPCKKFCCLSSLKCFNVYDNVNNKYLGHRGSIPDRGTEMKFFSLQSRPDRHWGTPNLLSNRYRGGGLSPGVRWRGREADHSYSSSAEVKNMWNYTSTPQYIFMALCLVKVKVKLSLYLTKHHAIKTYWGVEV